MKEDFKGKEMSETVGTIDQALTRFHDYMNGTAIAASRQISGYLDAEDLYQDFFLILSDIHGRFGSLPVLDFTKLFRTCLNNFVANLFSQKRGRNRARFQSLDRNNSNSNENDKTPKDFLGSHEMNDEDYKTGILDVLNSISPNSGMAILDSFDPKKEGNRAVGIKDAYKEVKKYLIG